MKLWHFLFGNTFSYIDLVGCIWITIFYENISHSPLLLGVLLIIWLAISTFVGVFIRNWLRDRHAER